MRSTSILRPPWSPFCTIREISWWEDPILMNLIDRLLAHRSLLNFFRFLRTQALVAIGLILVREADLIASCFAKWPDPFLGKPSQGTPDR